MRLGGGGNGVAHHKGLSFMAGRVAVEQHLVDEVGEEAEIRVVPMSRSC